MAVTIQLGETLVRHKTAVAAAALLLVLAGWLCWYFSDQQSIRRQLVGMAWDASRKEQESTMETAFKMRGVRSALTSSFRVDVPETKYGETMESDLVIRYLMYYRDRYESVAVAFEDMRIDIPAKGEAVVQSMVSVQKRKGQAPCATVRAPVSLGMKKQGGDWLVHQAKIAAVLLEE